MHQSIKVNEVQIKDQVPRNYSNKKQLVITGSPFSPIGPAPPTDPARPGWPMAPAGPGGPLLPVDPYRQNMLVLKLGKNENTNACMRWKNLCMIHFLAWVCSVELHLLCEKRDQVYMKQALFRQSVRLIIKTSKNYRKSQQEPKKIETTTERKPTKKMKKWGQS